MARCLCKGLTHEDHPLVLLLCLGIPLKAQEFLSPPMHYRKISMRLTGTDPSPEDYRGFQAQVEVCPDEVCVTEALAERVQGAFASAYFKGKVHDFTDELLDIKRDYDSNRIAREKRGLFPGDTLGNLVLSIFEENLSWDTFFTGGTFTNTRGNNSFRSYERAYLAPHLTRRVAPIPETNVPFTAQVEDARLRGGFTLTGLFNIRYPNTSINKGRGRAQAVIRVGLCDVLFPEAPLDDRHKRLEDQIARGHYFGVRQENREALHGQSPDCRQCHIDRGLDPLAQTFWATEVFLDTHPVPGRFIHRAPDGTALDVPVEGIGQWMETLVATDSYARCQVKHFWSFFVGDARLLEENPDLMEEVVGQFNARGRRALDFLEYLVLSEEFRRRETSRRPEIPSGRRFGRVSSSAPPAMPFPGTRRRPARFWSGWPWGPFPT